MNESTLEEESKCKLQMDKKMNEWIFKSTELWSTLLLKLA